MLSCRSSPLLLCCPNKRSPEVQVSHGALTWLWLLLSNAVNIRQAVKAGKQQRCFKRSPEPNPPLVGLINISFVFFLCQKAAIKENKSQSHHGAASASLVPPYPFQGMSNSSEEQNPISWGGTGGTGLSSGRWKPSTELVRSGAGTRGS